MGHWVPTASGAVFVDDAGNPSLIYDAQSRATTRAASLAPVHAGASNYPPEWQALVNEAHRQPIEAKDMGIGGQQLASGGYEWNLDKFRMDTEERKRRLQAEEGAVRGRTAVDPLAAKADQMNLTNYSPHGTILQDWLAKKAGK